MIDLVRVLLLVVPVGIVIVAIAV
eukprot:COSAG02_NODE_31012_length_540_cov_719.897959_2_plen_23_part_01